MSAPIARRSPRRPGRLAAAAPALAARLLSAALCCIAATGARAADPSAGTSTAQFLKLGAGARGAGMADACSAACDDIYSAYYNPAGLSLLMGPSLGATHSQYIDNARYTYAAFGLPVGKERRHALAFSVANLGVTNLERRSEDTDAPAGYFEASDYAYALAYAWRPPGAGLALGGAAKLVHMRIDDASGSAFAADLGARHRIAKPLPMDLALVLRHLGTGLRLGGESDPLPRAVVAGASVRLLPRLAASLDLVNYRDRALVYAAGAEYRHRFGPRLDGFLRAGYNNQRSGVDRASGLATGGGLAAGAFGFDFAWVPFGDLGETFRYSVVVRF